MNPHTAYKKQMVQGYFLAKDHLNICDSCAWSYGNGCMVLWKRMRSVYMTTFPDLYVMRWMLCFLEHVFPRSRMNARAFSRVI